MEDKRLSVGWVMCGSFCTLGTAMKTMAGLAADYDLVPVMSENVYSTDTRFGSAADFIGMAEGICGRRVIHTITQAEPLGPKITLDAMVIAPCTGNTLAKFTHAVTDTSATMAVKAFMRSPSACPLLIALATNDALSGTLANIAAAYSRKRVYFVPLAADDSAAKPHSLVARFELIPKALEFALRGEQLPLF
ncbi:MAG: dipicolinate synthase subunit B [Eubacteriales bacterium]